MPLGNDIDELLTGYLDGQLTDDDRRLIETAIHEDPTVAVRVQEMRNLSNELRALGQQVQRGLSSDFTSRVLARCRDEASLPATDAMTKTLLPGAKRLKGRTVRRVVSGLAALAGMIALAVWLPQWDRKETVINPIANMSQSNDGATDSQSVQETHSADLLASSESKLTETPSVDAPAFPAADSNDSNRLSSSHQMDTVIANASSSDGSSVDDEDISLDAGQLASQSPGGAEISYILVLDLELTALAAEKDILRSLLAKYGIGLALGVTLNSEIEKAVGRMRFSVPENQSTDSAELFLVRAPAAILDAALSEMEGEVELIPGYRFDLAFQTPSVSLSQAILDSVDVELPEQDALAIAVVADRETSQNARIEAIPYQGTLISTSRRRERFDSSIEELPAGSDHSYLLILVRRQ